MKLVIDFFLVGGIIITLLILLLLIKSKKRELSQNLLITFFIFLLLNLVHGYAALHHIPRTYILTFVFSDSLELFVAPLLLLYIKSLFLNPKKLIRNNLSHFLPFVLYVLFISIPIIIYVATKKDLTGYIINIIGYAAIAFTVLNIYLLTYLILALKLFNKFKNIMKSNYSNFTENEFGWVRHLLTGALIIVIIDLLTNVLEITEIINVTLESDFIANILITVFIGYLSYYGLNQSKVLLPNFLINEDTLTNGSIKKTNYLSNVSEKELEGLKERLDNIMNTEKLYLDEDLTLSKLAEQISITNKKLSTFLNQHLNTTFYDYVNKYRIESVKEKLKSNDFENLTLLGIAYESGFKSKTSFNRIFKKETGLSPSEYKKNL